MKPSGLTVSFAPHAHCGSSIGKLMYNQVFALLPAVAAGVYFFGLTALRVIAISIATAVVMELLMRRALKREMSVADGHAILVGLLLALLMPATAPWWLIVIGASLSIVVAKWLFGGLGAYAVNPVLIGWVMVSISWGDILSKWPRPFPVTLGAVAGMPVETPLEMLKRYGIEMAGQVPLGDMLIGLQAGGIGTVAGLAIIIGGVYLIARGLISWHIPVAYMAGVIVIGGIFRALDPGMYACPFFHLLTGMTLIGAFFIAPEYTTSPNTNWGKLLYGFGCGALIILIRVYGKYPDGTAFAILLMNICTPLFDRIRPKVTGILGKGVPADA